MRNRRGVYDSESKLMMAASASASAWASASSMDDVRMWRTGFLTLRDETLTSPLRTPIPQLLHQLIFSHSHAFLSAAPRLPLHEVTSDLLFLMELVTTTRDSSQDITPAFFTHLSCLIHDVCRSVPLQLNSSSWTLMLRFFGNLMEFFIGRAPTADSPNVSPLVQCLSTLGRLVRSCHRNAPPSDDILLVKFLLRIIAVSHSELIRRNQNSSSRIGKRVQQYSHLWEVQTVAFSMVGEAISRAGSSFPADVWKSTVEVLRKVMDVLASEGVLVEEEENDMPRFYASLLHCLHLVLVDPKDSLSDHVSGFVAALRLFFAYGITSRPQLAFPASSQKEKEHSLKSLKSPLEEPQRVEHGLYRPPHLRRRESSKKKQSRACNSQSLLDHDLSPLSSDSEYSDTDGLIKDTDAVQKAKVRIAAIGCIQDLCQADSKVFTTQWMLLLPTSDVLQARKFEATLLTCLLFDPYLKARIASASTLVVMLDGPSSVFLQVAEYKESSKCGSFTALSISLGHILMQLHTGILYLIRHETHGRLLASLFKILMLLISSTPYSRMPTELLPTVITCLQEKIEEGFPFKSDQTGLLAASIGCLTVAFTTSPSSLQIKEMLQKDVSIGVLETEKKSGVPFTLFKYAEQVYNPAVCFEALQALRAMSHNYPSIMFSCWEKVSSIVYGLMRTPEVLTRPRKGHMENTVGLIGEKLITAGIKVLDECLRALTGFKGTEDHPDDKLLYTPFTSDCIRMKKVSSAPLYELDSLEDVKDEYNSCESGILQWCEAIEKHMPLVLQHTSAMVRAASFTCFAGITSSVFFCLMKEKQEFIISSLIYAAEYDEVPSVKSASCRAIGVISCFPEVCKSAEIVDKFIHAVDINTSDPSVSVRITASWALANICDSIHHCINYLALKGSSEYNAASRSVTLLAECALRLSKDGDKIKSNAVRALGNLSRFMKFTTPSGIDDTMLDDTGLSLKKKSIGEFPSTGDWKGRHVYASNFHHPSSLGDACWLDKTVRAFISCVTTGNVKVQWNVCHALSNLFLNETLRLQDMDWAPSVFSILLLLLRDSSNFKIRIQAAVALAVPASVLDYGKSFSDIVQGLEHIIENLGSDQISAPSSFKYRVALEKQVTSTMLHVLSLASSSDHDPLKDFLVKKASVLEEWLKVLSLSLVTTSTKTEVESNGSTRNEKREMICKAIRSLIEVYKGRKHDAITRKFEKLEKSIN